MTASPADTASWRVLITGARGQVGRAWLELASSLGLHHHGIDADDLDLSRPELVTGDLVRGFTHVVHTAAWTDVDGAEQREAEATRVNGDAVAALARVCAAAGCTLLHYSTDYVFDAPAGTPIPVDAEPAPLNAYGRGKLAGERALCASPCRWLLVRTSWVYAPWGRNFVRTMLSLAASRPVLRVVNDQHGTPTSAEHLARCSLALLRLGALGVHHVTDGGVCSWHDLAQHVLAAAAPGVRVEPCATEDFPRPARRPRWSCLDVSATERLLGPMPGWRRNVDEVLRRMPDAAALPAGGSA